MSHAIKGRSMLHRRIVAEALRVAGHGHNLRRTVRHGGAQLRAV